MFFSKLKNTVLNTIFPLHCIVCVKEGVGALCASCMLIMQRTPPCCVICGRLSPARDGVPAGRTCRPCRRGTSIYGFLSPLRYEEPAVNALVRELKYRRVKPLASAAARILADYMTTVCPLRFGGESVIVPVPLHARRLRTRGFNQAELIAQEFAAFTGITADTFGLRRIRSTASQATLTHKERRANMEGAFRAETKNIAARVILLLDDVKTTGATLESAARALKKAGARQIWALTLAH